MLSQTEAHRLTGAVNALRPDWPLASLSTWIRNSLHDRAYQDAAVALVYVACDPNTETPARVLENGPWWRLTRTVTGATPVPTVPCPDHPAHLTRDCPECAALSDRADHAKGAAAARAAIKPPPKPNRPPEPPPRDLDAVRARADQEAT